jgi:hypothetical protein
MNNWMRYVIIGIIFLGSYSCITEKNTKITEGSADGSLAFRMYGTAVNNPQKEWSYSPKSTTVIGIPFTPKPVQVTFDGAIFTGNAELCFFYGQELKPTLNNQRHFYDGWIPIVMDDWEEDRIHYSIEMFGAQLEGEDSQNSIQFVKVTLHNRSEKKVTGRFAVAITASGVDHRERGGTEDHENALFDFNGNAFLRNGALVYLTSEDAQHYSVADIRFTGEYKGSDFQVKKSTPTGISVFNKVLAPNEKATLTFKMPRVPLDVKQADAFYQKFNKADYENYKKKTIDYWETLIAKKSYITIPEKRVNDSYKAGLVHLILATRNENGKNRQGSGLPYDELFFNDYVDMRRIYDLAGLSQFVEINTQWLIDNQNENGMFLDPVLTHGKEIMASHGQALVSLAHHYTMTRDDDYLKRIYPTMKKAVEWMQAKHEQNPNGLMPASTPFDAEMIKGHYTSHNLWCLLGLRDAIRVARTSGKLDDAEAWSLFHDSYKSSILKAIKSSVREDNYLPPGLYKYITGEEARAGFKEYRTNQDWENMLLVYPTEVLKPDDPIVSGTLNHIRKQKYREGIMTYRNGMHLHQYVTTNLTNQYLSINNQKDAILDLYHILLHNGSTHEGFENLVEPWEDRDPAPCPPPHAWAAAKTSLLIRNFLIREYGGDAGVNEDIRDLYLFSAISPEWTKSDGGITIHNMPTEMGTVSASMKFTDKGAEITISNNFFRYPNHIAIPIPYFVELDSVVHNASKFLMKNGIMFFSPDVSKIQLIWSVNKENFDNNFQNILLSYRREPGVRWEGDNIKEGMDANAKMNSGADLFTTPPGPGFLLPKEIDYPSEHLSFELVKKAFITEYNRRYTEYLEAGKKALILKSPYNSIGCKATN